MSLKNIKTVLITATVITSFALSGCASVNTENIKDEVKTTEETAVEETENQNELVEPQIVEIAGVDKTTQTGTVGQVFVVNVPEVEAGEWSATSSNPNVAVFVKGSSSASSVINPSFDIVGSGMSQILMTNSSTGATISFDIIAG